MANELAVALNLKAFNQLSNLEFKLDPLATNLDNLDKDYLVLI